MKRNYGILISALTLAILAAALTGCGGGGGGSAAPSNIISTREEARQPGTWTILVYLDADNDLETAGIHNFNQMEVVGSTRDVRVIVQMDRSANHNTSNGNWTDARRYLITRDSDTSTMHSVRLDETPLGELDMGSWQTLKNFVEWGVQEFPANHYCLVVWDHGSGWQIRSMDLMPEYKYIAVDDSSNNGMNVTDIPSALAGVNMDVVAFDACYMQQLEVAYELKNSAQYMVGSAGTEPSPGYNYARWLTRLNGSTTSYQLSRAIVDAYAVEYPSSYRDITQSVVDLSRIDEVADAASTFAQVLMNNRVTYRSDLKTARDDSFNYSTATSGPNRWFMDLWDYANRCTSALNPAASGAFASLNDALNNAVVAETHNSDTPYAHGLAIYMPAPGSYDARYGQLDLATDTMWDDWIKSQLD